MERFISTILINGSDKYDKNYELLTYNVKEEFFDSGLPYSYEQIEARTNYLVYNYSLVAQKNLKIIRLVLIVINILFLLLLIFYNLVYFKDILNSKKYEIGLLISFGYPKKNVSLIIFAQSLLLSITTFITFLGITYFTTPYFNSYFQKILNIDFDILEIRLGIIITFIFSSGF